jgi:hypothetical protein
VAGEARRDPALDYEKGVRVANPARGKLEKSLFFTELYGLSKLLLANQRTMVVHRIHHGENPIRKCNGRAV